jgi:MFS family permease
VVGPRATPAPSGQHFDAPARRLLVGVVGVVVAIAFEAIAVSTAMPVAARELGGLSQYGLAFSIFLTASLLGMVAGGELSDRRGPVLPFLAASVVFAVGLGTAAAAPTMGALVLARAIQGFGAGLNVVALYVVVARAYPQSLRPRVFSAMSGGWVVPALVGPPIAGVLADHVSWRAVFLLVLPLLGVGTLLVLPHLRGMGAAVPMGGTERSRSRLLPATAVAAGTGLLQYAGQHPSWLSIPLLAAAVALLVPSLPRLLPPGALRFARGLPALVSLRGVFAGAFFGAGTFVPLMLVEQRGLATSWAGASLTGGALTWAVGAWYQGRPRLRSPRTRLVTLGLALVGVGIVIVASSVSPYVPVWTAALGWVITGLGMGLGVTSLSVLVLGLSAPAEQGANSAAMQVSEAIASIAMIGLGGAIFAGLRDPRGDDAGAFLLVFAVMSAIALLGSLAARRSEGIPARPDAPPHPTGSITESKGILP